MNPRRHAFTKDRLTLRDQSLDRIHRIRNSERDGEKPWFKRRYNYLVLLMILVIFAMMIIVKSVVHVQDTYHQTPGSILEPSDSGAETEMGYEEAKRIFSETADSPG